MVLDEREAAVSVLLKKRSESRRRRTAIENELRAAGRSLYDIGGALKHVSNRTLRSRADDILTKFADVPEICDLGGMKKMLEELRELQILLDQLNRSASQMGLD